ncbi:MAG: hypothetical protein U0790_00890 [Isosphaeraceae bacterium]
MMTSYDRQMGHIQEKHPVMFMVGPLGIHLPDQLSRLCRTTRSTRWSSCSASSSTTGTPRNPDRARRGALEP